MGLDVDFYKNLVFWKDEDEFQCDDCDKCELKKENSYKCDYKYIHIWTYDSFITHYKPLKRGWYKADCIGGFRAGSYSGYGYFRRQLCLKVLGIEPEFIWHNPKKYKKRPFYYLINFADNEGTIAGEPYKKLQKDFKNFDLKFDEEWLNEKYQLWKEYVLKSECVRFG